MILLRELVPKRVMIRCLALASVWLSWTSWGMGGIQRSELIGLDEDGVFRAVPLENRNFETIETTQEHLRQITVSPDAARLFYFTDDELRSRDLDGQDLNILATELVNHDGLVLDEQAGTLYWRSAEGIHRVATDGTQATLLVADPTIDAFFLRPGVALYYLIGASVFRAGVDGSSPQPLVDLSVSTASSFVVNGDESLVHWLGDDLARTNVQSGVSEVLVQDLANAPYDLQFNGDETRLVWLDNAGVQSSDLLGQNLDRLFETDFSFGAFDWHTNTVWYTQSEIYLYRGDLVSGEATLLEAMGALYDPGSLSLRQDRIFFYDPIQETWATGPLQENTYTPFAEAEAFGNRNGALRFDPCSDAFFWFDETEVVHVDEAGNFVTSFQPAGVDRIDDLLLDLDREHLYITLLNESGVRGLLRTSLTGGDPTVVLEPLPVPAPQAGKFFVDGERNRIYAEEQNVLRAYDLNGVELFFRVWSGSSLFFLYNPLNGNFFEIIPHPFCRVDSEVRVIDLDTDRIAQQTVALDITHRPLLGLHVNRIVIPESSGTSYRFVALEELSQQLGDLPVQTPIDFSVDPVRHTLFWSEEDSNDIRKASAFGDGSDVETVVDTDLDPNLVHYESITDKLYWTDDFALTLSEADSDGNSVRTVLQLAGEHLFRAFCVNAADQEVFWYDGTAVHRANLSDGGAQTTIFTAASHPNVEALGTSMFWNRKSRRLFIVGTGTDSMPGRTDQIIFSIDRDGNDLQIHYATFFRIIDLAIDRSGNVLYWAMHWGGTNPCPTGNQEEDGPDLYLYRLELPGGETTRLNRFRTMPQLDRLGVVTRLDNDWANSLSYWDDGPEGVRVDVRDLVTMVNGGAVMCAD
ncbi:hypothetical protein SCOR_00425 [Sulfidibacter corallicola]|uniref:Uncharacterized protein n=1 Tax=Sulfidibacter corallicola TaxID=2818388 RepID=A0A8A4TJM2_SULCO|nr:hypothetical protein [Sulfidibacter corallicola]QTD49008.1 hypothetical protein J3U87_25770 [Sulfidibacter corallicola]